MVIWHVNFQVHKAFSTFPVPTHLELEVQYSSSYRNEVKRPTVSKNLLFVYTLEGEGIFKEREIEHRLTPGIAYICRVDDINKSYYYPEDGVAPWSFFWLMFSGDVAELMLEELIQKYGYIYKLDNKSELVRRLLSYECYDKKVIPMSPHQGGELIFDVLTNLAKSRETTLLAAADGTLVTDIQHFILQNITTIKVDQLARHFNTSREHLSRLFTDKTSMSLQDYITTHKMLYAGQLLKDSRLSCKEIAYRLNYENASNFTRCFRKVLKISPREFRKTGNMTVF